MNKSILLLFILTLALAFPFFLKIKQNVENYTNLGSSIFPNYQLNPSHKSKTFSSTDVLLQDSFPITGRSGVSNDQGSTIWWHYPIFEVGSYDQITNNIRFSKNPDTGNCMPADICGTLYKDFQMQSNYVFSLPPVKPECTSHSRINYYYTNTNMLPYKAETANILY
jgi:hypothetical protein